MQINMKAKIFTKAQHCELYKKTYYHALIPNEIFYAINIQSIHS